MESLKQYNGGWPRLLHAACVQAPRFGAAIRVGPPAQVPRWQDLTLELQLFGTEESASLFARQLDTSIQNNVAINSRSPAQPLQPWRRRPTARRWSWARGA